MGDHLGPPGGTAADRRRRRRNHRGRPGRRHGDSARRLELEPDREREREHVADVHCKTSLEGNPLSWEEADGAPIVVGPPRHDGGDGASDPGEPDEPDEALDPDWPDDADEDRIRDRNPDGAPIHVGYYDADGVGGQGGNNDADGNPDPNGNYHAVGNNIAGRHDAGGKPDPNGFYDADGNYVGGPAAPSGTPGPTPEPTPGPVSPMPSHSPTNTEVITSSSPSSKPNPRHDDDGNPDPDGNYDTDGNIIGGRYNAAGNPDPDGNYDAYGTFIGERYDADGNPDLGGNYGADGNYIGERYNADGNQDSDGIYDTNGNYIGERYNADGNPDLDGNYDSNGNYIGERYEADGNPDPLGNYDAYGNYIGQRYNADGNPDSVGNYDDDGNYIGERYDADGNLDSDGTYDTDGDYIGERYDADGNPDSFGNYDADGNYIGGRFDASGNPDPYGLYDADSNYIGGRYGANGNPDPNGDYDADGNYSFGGRYNADGERDPYGLRDENGVLIAGPTWSQTLPASPAASPATSPTTSLVSTAEPSHHPTLHGDPWVLRGTIYYDRNANGRRDSDVNTVEYGNDAEFDYGLGGVTVRLVECDPETNMGLGGFDEDSYASTVSQGYDVLMHPKLVGKEENGGNYNLIDIEVDRAYYIHVAAPGGYLLSGGICNDDMPGWECGAAEKNEGRTLRVGVNAAPAPRHRRGLYNEAGVSEGERELGIHTGRSEKCVRVNQHGMPESHLDVGAMRIGDVAFGDAEVVLSVDLIGLGIDKRRRRRRSSPDAIRRGLERSEDDDRSFGDVLLQEDKEAIGIVTSEVIASKLDISLPERGAVLDSVSPIDVEYFSLEPIKPENFDDSNNITNVADAATAPAPEAPDTARDATTVSRRRTETRGKLLVSVLVKGHYNKGDVSVDFDFASVVHDSIVRDAEAIREQLTSYNVNCRHQTNKVLHLGYTVEDFLEVQSNRGVDPRKSWPIQRQQEATLDEADLQVFSTACDRKKALPDYFKESLGGLRLEANTEVRVRTSGGGGSNVVAIVGSVLAWVSISLCMCYFLYRRAEKKQRKVGATQANEPRMSIRSGRGTLCSSKTSDDTYHSMIATPVPTGGGRGCTRRLQRELSNIGMVISDEKCRAKELKETVSRRNARCGGDDKSHVSNQSRSSNKSGNARNAFRIINEVNFDDSIKLEGRSIDDVSSSSSDEGESSDSSSKSIFWEEGSQPVAEGKVEETSQQEKEASKQTQSLKTTEWGCEGEEIRDEFCLLELNIY